MLSNMVSTRDPQTTPVEVKKQKGTTPSVLVIDVGGTNVKLKVDAEQTWVKFKSGRALTVNSLVGQIKTMTADWRYDVATVGYPGPVVFGHIVGRPPNLAPRGWIGYDFGIALGCPTKVTNDAVLQAIGSYRGDSMLFLGLGTGIGCTMIVDGISEQVVLDELTYIKKRGYDSYLSKRARKRLGHRVWEKHVHAAVENLIDFFDVDYVVIGGGGAEELERLPKGAMLADRDAAFIGGRRLWEVEGAR